MAWLVLFGTFLGGGEVSEKPLESEQTEMGEGCDCEDRASSWIDREKLGSLSCAYIFWEIASYGAVTIKNAHKIELILTNDLFFFASDA